MEYDIPYRLIATVLVIVVITWFIIRFMNTVPAYPRVSEAFYGGVARGSGHPDCLRTLPEGSEILDRLQRAKQTPPGLSDANADYAEMQLLLSKMACLKKDLMSPSGIPEATRYQAFETAHDRIAVAELTGMCLSKNIPSRDLDIIFGTWRERGQMLLRKLCTEADLSEKDATDLEKLFSAAWKDVYQIATSQCLKSESIVSSNPDAGDVAPYDVPSSKTQRSYDFQYGGLSASGWNGAV
jgi:hypothetical protein